MKVVGAVQHDVLPHPVECEVDAVQRVVEGRPFPVELSWRGLDPTSRWFGTVRYGSSDERTFVTVN